MSDTKNYRTRFPDNFRHEHSTSHQTRLLSGWHIDSYVPLPIKVSTSSKSAIAQASKH